MSSHRSAPFLFLLLLAPLTMAACSPTHPSTEATSTLDPRAAAKDPGAAPAAELAGAWSLEGAAPQGGPGLGFEAEEVTGTTGVNRLRGQVELAGQGLRFGQLILTKRAGPPEAMEQERTFLKKLRAVRSFEIRGDRLVLHGEDKQPLLSFVRPL